MTIAAPSRPRAPAHRPSHRGLLDLAPAPVAPGHVDALVVPAARDASRLQPVMRLAAELEAPLVVLCSQLADAALVRQAAWRVNPRVVAVTVRDGGALPQLLTSTLLADWGFTRRSDTAVKRNLGLALTRMTGWERVLCLDDDITGVTAGDVREAAGLLPRYGAVGLRNTGYPDNSVVCHANRDTGAEQDTFIGGGAMLYPASRVTSFFPDVYNEDWFFLLDDDNRLVPTAVHGSFAQAPYDPYPNPGRAGQEEFGDCLAEGLFALLDAGLTVAHADLRFWREFIAGRSRLIESILRRTPGNRMSTVRWELMAASLRAARASLLRIEPQQYVAYLEAWRHDRKRWANFVNRLPRSLSAEQALGVLGLKF